MISRLQASLSLSLPLSVCLSVGLFISLSLSLSLSQSLTLCLWLSLPSSSPLFLNSLPPLPLPPPLLYSILLHSTHLYSILLLSTLLSSPLSSHLTLYKTVRTACVSHQSVSVEFSNSKCLCSPSLLSESGCKRDDTVIRSPCCGNHLIIVKI